MKQLIIIILSIIPFTLQSQQFGVPQFAKVIAIHDGDSYGVRFLDRPDTTIFIRLHNVDAPEVIFYVTKDQPYSRQAAQNVRDQIKGDTVSVTPIYKDVFGRLVCDVLDDSIDLTEWVIMSGNAWYQSDSATSLEREAKLKDLQKFAEKKKFGLWGQPGRKLRPDTWRKRYSRI